MAWLWPLTRREWVLSVALGLVFLASLYATVWLGHKGYSAVAVVPVWLMARRGFRFAPLRQGEDSKRT